MTPDQRAAWKRAAIDGKVDEFAEGYADMTPPMLATWVKGYVDITLAESIRGAATLALAEYSEAVGISIASSKADVIKQVLDVLAAQSLEVREELKALLRTESAALREEFVQLRIEMRAWLVSELRQEFKRRRAGT